MWITVPGCEAIRRDLPQLLEADRELRRLASCRRAGSRRISSLVRLPRTPSQKIVTFAWMSTPGSNVGLLLAVLADAAIAGAHADDARAVHQHVLPGEAA